MELYLQFGYGMKKLTIDLSKEWGGVNVILSPRDIYPEQLKIWSNDFAKANVSCLFDPQCYFPKCNHKNLIKYEYWLDNLDEILGSNDSSVVDLIKKLEYYNSIISAEKFIIPGIMRKFDSEWFSLWKRDCLKLSEATRKVVKNRKAILTVAIPWEILCQGEDNIEEIIELTNYFDVNGYYVAAEPYNNQYLVDHPVWMSNLLQLCAGLKLQNREVIVSNANHQLLCLSAAKVNALASGTYQNVRMFSRNKYESSREDDIRQRNVWYYYPQALSEYTIPFLDAAFHSNIIEELKPTNEFLNPYIELLFSGVQPSSTEFNETLAFKHYLHSLRQQVKLCTRSTFHETINANEVLLQTAERRIEFLESKGIYAQSRSFRDIVDVNRSALQRLQATRQFLLQFSWDEI